MGKLLSRCLKRLEKSKSNDSPRESRQPSIELNEIPRRDSPRESRQPSIKLNEIPRRDRAGTSVDDPVIEEIHSRRATVGAVTEWYISADSGTRKRYIDRMSQLTGRMLVTAQDTGHKLDTQLRN